MVLYGTVLISILNILIKCLNMGNTIRARDGTGRVLVPGPGTGSTTDTVATSTTAVEVAILRFS